MTLELIATGFFSIILIYALFKFRKPINRIKDQSDKAVAEWCKEWSEEMEEGHRERTLERMRDFLDKQKYIPSEILFDRLRCHDKESRYFSIANDQKKLDETYMLEDLYFEMELKKRQDKIRDLITVIEKIGEWPKETSEIYEIMKIKWKGKR